MKAWRLFLLLALAAPAQLAAAAPASINEETFRIRSEETREQWRPLFEQLTSAGALYSEFVERRFFTFRSEPSVLIGQLRLDPERGLSLHYTDPDDRIIIVDDRGVLVRDAKGRTRTAPAEAATNARPLLHVLRFNVDELLTSFALYGARDADSWRLALEPLERPGRRPLPTIEVFGRDVSVQKIVLLPSARQRIEIEIGTTRTQVVFTREELQRYFR
jgi:outer membrane lipoprotein-sorting protein